MNRLLKAGAVVLAVFVAGSAWTLVQFHTQAAVQVQVNDVALATPTRRWASPHDVTLLWRDDAGHPLARAHSVEPAGHIVIVHPDPSIGDCTRFAGAPGAGERGAYARCWKEQARWASGWADRVARADVVAGSCRIAAVPVQRRTSTESWWLWWVPLPHVSPSPYRHVGLELTIDTRACAAAAAR